jgi:phage-related protein
MNFPVSHVADALELEADAIISLFELYPIAGGEIFFKPDNTVSWRGQEYEGLPCSLSGEEWDTEKTPTPRMQIGQEDLDLLPFKGLIHDGYLEGSTIVRHKVLLTDLLNNNNIKRTSYYRVTQVERYTRTQISMVLASFSGAIRQTIPFRQYIPPAFPWVDI